MDNEQEPRKIVFRSLNKDSPYGVGASDFLDDVIRHGLDMAEPGPWPRLLKVYNYAYVVIPPTRMFSVLDDLLDKLDTQYGNLDDPGIGDTRATREAEALFVKTVVSGYSVGVFECVSEETINIGEWTEKYVKRKGSPWCKGGEALSSACTCDVCTEHKARVKDSQERYWKQIS